MDPSLKSNKMSIIYREHYQITDPVFNDWAVDTLREKTTTRQPIHIEMSKYVQTFVCYAGVLLHINLNDACFRHMCERENTDGNKASAPCIPEQTKNLSSIQEIISF